MVSPGAYHHVKSGCRNQKGNLDVIIMLSRLQTLPLSHHCAQHLSACPFTMGLARVGFAHLSSITLGFQRGSTLRKWLQIEVTIAIRRLGNEPVPIPTC